MGVLVHPNYSDELANGVAATFDPIYDEDGWYYVNTQLGEDLVTNPEAHSVPEELLLHSHKASNVLATSNLLPRGEMLLSEAQRYQLRRHLEVIHDEFKKLYDPERGEPFAMEIEFKITSANVLSIKQARPWVFYAAQPPSDNNLASGEPNISGTAQVDATLTADISGIADADGLDNSAFDYQWSADGSDISGATDSTYMPSDDDAGKTIRVRVSFTDDAGNDEALLSKPTATVVDTVVWESELTAGLLTDVIPVASGYSIYGTLGGALSPDSFVIDGTTYRIRFLVHATEALWLSMHREMPVDFNLRIGDSTYLGSDSKAPADQNGMGTYWWPLASPEWPAGEPVQVSLSTYPEVAVGSRQNAPITGYFSDFPTEHDGSEDVSFRINFSEGVATTANVLRDHVLSVSGGVVPGVTAVGSGGRIWAISVTPASTDNITVEIEADLDCELSSAVCAADGRRLFNRMELVIANPNNAATGAPSISGTAQLDATLTAGTFGIADADGLTNATFRYQWSADDSDIAGATASTYTPSDDDVGKAIKVRVTFTDDAGYDETLTSVATSAVAARPNSPATGAPSISGTAQVDATLTADTSGIGDADGLENVSYNYQWIRNDGQSDTNIDGAASATYALVADDEDKTIKVRVSFTDDAGNEETLTSPATAAVTPAADDPTETDRTFSVASPDNNLIVTVTASDGNLTYAVSRDGNSIISDSPLSIRSSASHTVTSDTSSSHDTTWSPTWGQFSSIRDHHNRLTLNLDVGDASFDLIFKVYNDGLGFRFTAEEQTSLIGTTVPFAYRGRASGVPFGYGVHADATCSMDAVSLNAL